MSVCLIISNPNNVVEEKYNIPISTEKVFQEYWMPIIEKLDLKWARCFESGIEIEKEDLEPVLRDLEEIKSWIDTHMKTERGDQIIERIDNLCEQLSSIFNDVRADVKVYIG